MVNKITKNNTKAEILAAYLQILKSYTRLEKEASTMQAKQKASNGNGSKKDVSIQTNTSDESVAVDQQNKESMQQTNNNNHYNLDKILASLENLQVGFGSAASKLSEKLIKEASKLEELREAVSETKKHLKELHNLDEFEDNTLDLLIESYKKNARTYEDEYADQKETLEHTLQSLQQGWRQEQEKHQQQIKERDESHKKSQKRADEEYNYDLQLKRDLEEDEYIQRKQNLYQKLKEQKEEQERQWQLREEEISKRESEYKIAQEKVEIHEQEKEKSRNDGRDKGQRIGSSQAKIELDLLTKEINGDRQNYLLRIKMLEQTIKDQMDSIKNLTTQLDGTLKQVQDLAVKAIEGSSNRNAFDVIKEVTNELAKNQHKGK